ncbi:MAG: hypothetical protein HYV40_03435, partial [Candidatus Levybacteria bacterium]|nr:hypothetical protein [Candidatus Levybacteria bacterium]
KIYSGKPFYITVKDSSGKVVNTSGALACSGLDAELSNNETLHLSTNNSSSIYTPGSYSLTVYCFSGRMKDEGRIADGTASFEVVDASTVIPDDLKDKPGACEICHPDWPAYDATQQDVNSRCRGSDIATDEKYNRTLRPIKTDTCTKGYVCNHLIGCVIPTGGIKPPPQPCKRGVKFVKEAAPVGGGVAVTREVETTDPKEIDKCLEFDTGVSVLGLDPGAFISSVFSVLLSLSGMIALYLIIRSGYRMMTSRGNPEAIQEARERLVSAIVGLLLIIFSLVALSVIGVNLLRIPGFGS